MLHRIDLKEIYRNQRGAISRLYQNEKRAMGAGNVRELLDALRNERGRSSVQAPAQTASGIR